MREGRGEACAPRVGGAVSSFLPTHAKVPEVSSKFVLSPDFFSILYRFPGGSVVASKSHFPTRATRRPSPPHACCNNLPLYHVFSTQEWTRPWCGAATQRVLT